MNPILVGVAVAVIAGAIVTVSVRDARTTVLGLAVVLVATPLLADPMAAPLGLAARLVGSILGAYLLWIVVRDRPADGTPETPTDGSRIGWPAETLVAIAAALVGFVAHGLGAGAVGPAVASAAGSPSRPSPCSRPSPAGTSCAWASGCSCSSMPRCSSGPAWAGRPMRWKQLLTAGLIAALCATSAAVAFGARLDGSGGFAFATDARPRARREPDAHRIEPS